MIPFLSAFAEAAARMPGLKDTNAWTSLVWYIHDEGLLDSWLEYEHVNDRSLAWGLAYDKPSEGISCKLTWRVSKGRPDERLHTLFQNIGREQYGDDLVGRKFFSDYEACLAYRSWRHSVQYPSGPHI